MGYLPRELRVKLFAEVLRLRRRGCSYREIIEHVRKVHGVTLYKSTVSEWLRGLHSPFKGIRIPSIEFLRPSESLAYIIGVVAGDGYAIRKSMVRKGYRGCFIGLEVKDKEFAEEFSRSIAEALGRKPPKPRINKDGKWVVEVKSKTLYELLSR